MAQSKKTASKTKQTAKKGETKAKKPAKAGQQTPPPPPPPPIRREVWGVVCAFLAIFMLISYFNTDGAFIAFFANLIKGLIGWGFWMAVPAFFVMSYILFTHKGKPVSLRISCAMLLPVIFAALANLCMCPSMVEDFELKAAVGSLFLLGQAMDCGGVLGGLIATGLEAAFSVYGAIPILLVIFIALIVAVFKLNPLELMKRMKTVRAKEYDPEMYKDAEPLDDDFLAPVKPKKEETQKSVPARTKKEPKIEYMPAGSFADIPLGEDEDALTLLNTGSGSGEPYSVQPRPRRTVKSRQESIDSLTPPALGNIVDKEGVDVGDGFKEYSMKSRTAPAPKTVTATAEITDPPKSRREVRTQEKKQAEEVAATVAAVEGEEGDYVFPPTSLLQSGGSAAVDAREEMNLNRERLESAIHSFGISAAIVGVTRGPTVTRYDLELEQGVKLARVTNLSDDIALALGVQSVRIAPTPDKISTVGIEVPNRVVSPVLLRDILESPRFISAKSKLSFALGKDIGGECIVGNISKLPHMLIAGTTGSGKSVCMNSLILSLLYKSRPDEVRLIMVDPKMVELGIYNSIPHLYVPVVTDPKKAAGALQWSVVEMMKRYSRFAELGVRNLEGYNEAQIAAGEPTMPHVVIVIDELADLMLVASKEVEESICRVAQMGRAAGMHLVIATQRPSSDVITGLMKANIPSRIAFAVSSSLESRIILDQTGAEKLIGHGDMLFAPLGGGKPKRIQGAFVSDEEREAVVNFIKQHSGSTQRNGEIEEFMNKAAEEKPSGDGGKAAKDEGGAESIDDMLPQAVEAVLEIGSCSVSMLQRRIKLGYSRAARIVDQMEELGIVGPYEGAKPRQVVIDRAGWQALQVRLGLIEDEGMALAAEMSAEDDEALEPYDFDENNSDW